MAGAFQPEYYSLERVANRVSYPLPLQVHVIWHPRDDALCRPLAERIYVALNRDPDRPLLPGIGIPVFFRCGPADPHAPDGTPRPIEDAADTECDLRLALASPELALDDAWLAYLDANEAAVRADPLRRALVVFDLADGAMDGRRLAVRLAPGDPRLVEQLLQHVLMQACRLLGGRPRGGGGTAAAPRGAAPLRLFISHTKRDGAGLKVATAVKRYLDGVAVERFFDEVSIQPGDDIGGELEAAIADAALVAVRTDGYVGSPWCRRELELAKRGRRPMVVLDALARREPRSSPLLAHLPGMRLAEDALDEATLERAANFVGFEVLRYLYAAAQLRLLQEASLLPADAILLTRPPEARDLGAVVRAAAGARAGSTPPILVHPDPVMSAEEAAELEALGAVLATPTGLWGRRLEGVPLGLSLSPGDPAELTALGLSSLHVEDAMRVIARQALAAGATLHYGGMLAPGSLTEALFEIIAAYNRDGLKLPPLVNHTPWPWFEEVDTAWLAKRRRMLDMRRCEPPDDARAFASAPGPGHVDRLRATAEGRFALARSLTRMREQAVEVVQARVALGGKPHDFLGVLPGVVEEVLISIRRSRPVYVLGGFGGAARLLSKALAGGRPKALSLDKQRRLSPSYGEMLDVHTREHARAPAAVPRPPDYAAVVSELNAFGVAGLSASNGLSEDENRALFTTASVDAAVSLLMRGLSRIAPKRP